MWQRKWRGTLEEYEDKQALRPDASVWIKVNTTVVSQMSNWPFWRVGLGTYKWKYDPKIIKEAVARGVRLIDTAETYGYGRVEKELGNVLSKIKSKYRSMLWVATKVASNHMSYKAVLNAGRRSRDRLKVDSISLYQIHWPPPTPSNPSDWLKPAMDALAQLLTEGTIERIGVCNFCVGQLYTAIRLANQRGITVQSNQIRVNLADQSAYDYLLPKCEEAQVEVIGHSPLAQGQLPSEALGTLLNADREVRIKRVIVGTNNIRHLTDNLSLNR